MSASPALSVVLPYYRNPRMLFRQLLIWREEWPDSLKAQTEVVIVDDGSPAEDAAADIVQLAGTKDLPPISVYRVKEDRPWHQHGARNLGAHVAAGAWLLMTDIDHVIPADTLGAVFIEMRSQWKFEALTFGRVDAPMTLTWRAHEWREFKRTTHAETGDLKPHVNSFALPRAAYWDVGGYDESYCGVYGTDQRFRGRLWSKLKERHLAEYPLIRVSRDVIPDASTTGLPRKDGPDGHGNGAAKKRIAKEKAQRGEASKIVTLNFEWERVLWPFLE